MSNKHSYTHRGWSWPVVVLALLTTACGTLDLTDPVPPPTGSPEAPLPPTSQDRCIIHADCVPSQQCFEQRCVSDCVEENCGPPATQYSHEDSNRHHGMIVERVGSAEKILAPGDASIRVDLQAYHHEGLAFYEYIVVDVRGNTDGKKYRAPIPPNGRMTLTIPVASVAFTSPSSSTTEFNIRGSAGSVDVMVRRQSPIAGLYVGEFYGDALEGRPLPLTFQLITHPPSATSLATATEAWVALPTNPDVRFSLSSALETHDWIEVSLAHDTTRDVWVATLSEQVPPEAYAPFSPRAPRREVRMEIFDGEPNDASQLVGYMSDRWFGLSPTANESGQSTPSTIVVDGTFAAARIHTLVGGERRRGAEPLPVIQPQHTSAGYCTDALVHAMASAHPACDDFLTRSRFATGSPEYAADCLLDIHDALLANDSARDAVASYFLPSETPTTQSFSEFLEQCAQGTLSACRPRPDIHCARGLTADVFTRLDNDSPSLAALMDAFHELQSEATFAQQIIAFHRDNETRLSWLRNQEAPLFLATDLLAYNQRLMDSWHERVLVGHETTLGIFMDSASQAVLFRASHRPEIREHRRELLQQAMESWSAVADGLTLWTRRQHVLQQNARQREREAAKARGTLTHLYASWLVLKQLADDLHATPLLASAGHSLAVLEVDTAALATPFASLLFRRDAELITNQSLDPQASSTSLLRDREVRARAQIDDAYWSVEHVLTTAQQRETNYAALSIHYQEAIRRLRDEIVDLCGLPTSCRLQDIEQTSACSVRTVVAHCGYSLTNPGSGTPLPSQAGDALIAIGQAELAQAAAYSRAADHADRIQRYSSTLRSLEQSVEAWNTRRRNTAAEIDALTSDIQRIQSEQLRASLSLLEERNAIRDAVDAEHAQFIASWATLTADHLAVDFRHLNQMSAIETTIDSANSLISSLDKKREALIEGLPRFVGLINDPSAAVRGALHVEAAAEVTKKASAFKKLLSRGASVLQTGAIITAPFLPWGQYAFSQMISGGASNTREGRERLMDAERTRAGLARIALQSQTAQNIERLQDVIEHDARISSAERREVDALVRALKTDLDNQIAYNDDLTMLEERAMAVHSMLLDSQDFVFAVMQAELLLEQRTQEYLGLVQRAGTLSARYLDALERWNALDNVLGSPSVIFGYANDMALTEERIHGAKSALEDWLVALEYYAVRPFVAQRLAILLARNPQQLEAIANELQRLQSVCGGPTNHERLEVSVRDAVLGTSHAVRLHDGTTLSAHERFQRVLRRAEVSPLGRIAPLSASQTVHARLVKGNVLATHFHISLHDFANLSVSCNAKLHSIAVRLVGLEEAHALPVVHVIYDGQGQLSSCQPDLPAIVDALGPEQTAFAEHTTFQTGARAIAPIAQFDDFGPPVTWNATLEGTPLAAGYTVLIDLEHPSNQAIDWSKLEDIRLQFAYSYQDVFPEGQCE